MKQERLTYLIGRIVENQISAEEKTELRELLNTHDITSLSELGVNAWLDENITAQILKPDNVLEQQVNAILSIDKNSNATDNLNRQFNKAAQRVHFLRKWGWAAAILILFGAGIYFFKTKNERHVIAEQQNTSDEIVPGTNKALLTLSDGSTITLDSAANGAIAQQGNSSVIKQANGEIRYDVKNNSGNEIVMNTMTTPRGGQYQLVLPDGSRIWLNAASAVTYPTYFTGNVRKIKISGEAYLEIAKDKTRPFVVDVDGKIEVLVLGTSFNINSYADDGLIKTTLIDGSVKINGSVILKPGRQGRNSTNDKVDNVKIINANISQVLAWKNGMFNLEGADIKEVMNQVARWYDLQINYEDNIPPTRFVGKLPRNLPLNEFLKVLEDFEVHFRLEGRRLTVMP